MRRFLALLAVLVAIPFAGHAQQLLESYTALLSRNDHYNSSGQRLTEPWQIIRQDRANFHRFGTGDPQDEWDSVFASIQARAAAEEMLRNGFISPAARNAIVNGPALVRVEIYGRAGRPTAIRVDVAGGGTMQGTGRIAPTPPATTPPAPTPTALIESYVAFLSRNDHYNSNGQRLTEPWQIIRQDRANYHRFGTGDARDQWDSVFGSAENRALAERMLRDGYISPAARRAIVNGEAMIRVEIFGRNGRPFSIRVDVF